MATPDPRHAYVRAYLSALDDLDRVIASLTGAHASARESLKPYDDVLRDVPGAPGRRAPAALRSTARCGARATPRSSRASRTCTRSSGASRFRAKTTRTSPRWPRS